MQRLEPLSEGGNGSKGHQFDDLFGALSRRKYKRENNVKDDSFPEFHGNYNADVFEEWLNTIESLLEYHDVPDGGKVKLVSQHLKDHAYNWWKQLQVGRQRKGLKMKKKLVEQF